MEKIKPPEIFHPPKFNWKDIARYVSEVLGKKFHPSQVSHVWRGNRLNAKLLKVLKTVMPAKEGR